MDGGNISPGEIVAEKELEQAVRRAWMVIECISENKAAKVEMLGPLEFRLFVHG